MTMFPPDQIDFKGSKTQKKKPVQQAPKKKGNSDKNRIKVLGEKLRKICRKLEELQAYKRLVAQDGIKPDAEDKDRETQLIRLKIRHEREIAALEGRTIVKNSRKRPSPPKNRRF